MRMENKMKLKLTFDQRMTLEAALLIATDRAGINAAAYEDTDARWASAAQREETKETAEMCRESAAEYSSVLKLVRAAR